MEDRDRTLGSEDDSPNENKLKQDDSYTVVVVDKENMEQKTIPDTLQSVTAMLLRKSSVYAVSQLGSSKTHRRKFMWAFVLIIGLIGCIFEIFKFLSLYFQYPVVVTLEVENKWKLDFPAVTVCNLNRMRYGFLKDNEICDKFNLTMKDCWDLAGQLEIRPRSGLSERRRFASCSNTLSGVYAKEHAKVLKFMNLYTSLDSSQRQALGHQARDFIVSCSFNGEECSYRNFSYFQSMQYGNCYTFNGKTEEHQISIETPYVGPNSGLEVDLDLELDHYIAVSGEVGARVVIHESGVDPNPEDEGISIGPGLASSVAVHKLSIRRLPHPYRDGCRVYGHEGGNSSSTQENCVRECIQMESLAACHCVDSFFPAEPDTKQCDLTNKGEVCCLDKVLASVSETGLPCDCPLPCVTTTYDLTISSAIWPSFIYYDLILPQTKSLIKSTIDMVGKTKWDHHKIRTSTQLPVVSVLQEKDLFNDNNSEEVIETSTFKTTDYTSIIPHYRDTFQDEEIFDKSSESRSASSVLRRQRRYSDDKFRTEGIKMKVTKFREQRAKLKVFYRTLELKSYRQEPMYQDSELFSQLGGQMGLWLGLSLVALFECIESLLLLAHFWFTKAKATH